MPTFTLPNDGGVLGYSVAGTVTPDCKAIICVPGMGDLKEEYRFLLPQLQAAGYVAIALDLRGHGESAAASSPFKENTPDAVGRDIVALIAHLQLKRVGVVGDSMACASAVWAAAELPDVIKGIALCGAFVRDVPVSAVLLLVIKIMVAWPWGPWLWTMYYGSLYPTRKPADFAEYTARLRANLRHTEQLHALQRFLAASKSKCEARIPEVKCPVVFVMGSKDPDFSSPRAEAEEQTKRFANAKPVVMVDGAGHYPHAEFPDVVGPAITAFFNDTF